MTEQELRWKIWFIEQEVRLGNLSETEATDQILEAVKEAGYTRQHRPLIGEVMQEMVNREGWVPGEVDGLPETDKRTQLKHDQNKVGD